MNIKGRWHEAERWLRFSIREWLKIGNDVNFLLKHADASDQFLSEIMLETCNSLTDVDVVLAQDIAVLKQWRDEITLSLAKKQLEIDDLTSRLRYYESNVLNYHKTRYEQQRSA